MQPDEQPPWVPAPREGGHDTGWEHVGHPLIPAPRPAPSLERLPGVVATLTERPPAPRGTSAAVVLAPRHTTALAVIDLGVSGVLRAWGRTVVRLVHAAVAGVRALVAPVVPAPR